MKRLLSRSFRTGLAAMLIVGTVWVSQGLAVPLLGGTLDPLTIPKYVTPLVIPPVMKSTSPAAPNDYDIAVRQFQQQILPTGFPATTVWSYGPASDSADIVAPDPSSQFNYPAYTIEATKDIELTVDWINDLKDPDTGDFLEHILPIDQTLHWANPLADCSMGPSRTDCRGTSPNPYQGPVPIVTHVHGAHVTPESDGYPEAWWLPSPVGSNFLCTNDPDKAGTHETDDPNSPVYYMCQGYLANKYGPSGNTNVSGDLYTPGIAHYIYPNDQPSTTLWYHDHSLGMTRNNVYAGPAGFWLIREDGGGETGLNPSYILPGPAPAPGETLLDTLTERAKYREIPIVIQDRSFNADGSLFYPANRAFFEGLGDGVGSNSGDGLDIPFLPSATSDISPIWNPEAFFNVMVVNGVAWPILEVAPAIYRFRLLNGCNSRFLNLALKTGNKNNLKDVPFYQIGTEQSLMPYVVRVETGFATPLPGDGRDVCFGKSGTRGMGNCLEPVEAADPLQALLMGLAERADVLVDFRDMADGDMVTMVNTAPDEPFGGFADLTPADPSTTGQVMQFRVNTSLLGAAWTDPVIGNGNKPNQGAATPPTMLVMDEIDGVSDYPENVESGYNPEAEPRDLALIEEESDYVCVSVDAEGNVTYIPLDVVLPFDSLDEENACYTHDPPGVPFAPKEAVLGVNGSDGRPTSAFEEDNEGAQVTLWSDPIETNPLNNATEVWELWNWTGDAHPIHLHLVKFKVLGRRGVENGDPSVVPGNGVQPWENGWKDTVIAYPDEVTTLAATFDTLGLYVWHCHIVEHEDNEMMVPYCVGDVATAPGCAAADTPIESRGAL